MKLSVIIPIYNSLKFVKIQQTYLKLLATICQEIIIVDGGSTDNSLSLLKGYKIPKIKILSSKKGRGKQLQTGALAATGDYLLFLHIDSFLMTDSFSQQFQDYYKTNNNNYTLGFFKLNFDSLTLSAKLLAKAVALRIKYWQLPYGDQGLLVAKKLYQKIGGYNPEFPIMEDVDFIARFKKFTKKNKKKAVFYQFQITITTSFDKYLKSGFLKQIGKNLLCLLLFKLRIHPKTIQKIY